MTEIVFKRKAYDQMLLWKEKSQGKSALLIEGARRIGKSTIAEQFAKNEYRSYLLLDFNKVPQKVKDLFDDLEDLDFIFLFLQSNYRVKLHERQSVIIFDEVQKCPLARQAIKYLVADGRYDYIETGSLISIRKNVQNITIPSEEYCLPMYPMDYEEFRWALGDTVTMPLLKTFLEKKMSLKAAHQLKQRELRLYMLVGGMPQAVSSYLETNNLSEVDLVKRSIVKLYADDFVKIDPTGKIAKLFMSIPSQLSKNIARFQPTKVVGNINAERLGEMIFALEDSKVVNVAYHADDPNVGMSLTKDLSRYKLFLSDTGLFVTLAFWDKSFTENIIYEKLLSDKLPANLGYVYENLVAQMLKAAGNELFFYTFPKDEKHNYEVDFLLTRGSKICPIEVKPSGYNAHVSLDAFCKKYASRVSSRYLIYTKDLMKDSETLCVPAYMTGLL